MEIYQTYSRVQAGQMQSGRGRYAIRHIVERLEKYKNIEPERVSRIIVLCNEADQHFHRMSELERKYKAQTHHPNQSPREVDREADRIISNFYKALQAEAQGFEQGSTQHKAATHLLANIYPKGVSAIIHQTYVEQLESMKTMVAFCKETSNWEVIQTLGFEHWITRIEGILPKYQQAVDWIQSNTQKVSYRSIRRARQLGQQYLRRIIVAILDAFSEFNDEMEEIREDLLYPIQQQEEALRIYRKQHKKLRDIDPQTGEEVDNELESQS